MINYVSQYEDLKVLFFGAGFVTDHEEECGYDEYIFAVRKEWLRDKLMAMSDNPAKWITDDELKDWLMYNYSCDEAYALYGDADKENEIVFEGPVYNRGRHGAAYRTLYTVREQQLYDGGAEDRTIYQTTDLSEAVECYKQEKAKVFKNIEDDDFIIQDSKGEEHVIDGLPQIVFESRDKIDCYELFVEKTEFTDWRK